MSGERSEARRDQDSYDGKKGDAAVSTPGSEGLAQGTVSVAPDMNAQIPDKIESAGLSEGELRHKVQRQVEYYFSRENLMSDHYLMTQMDRDQFVPVSVIAGFNQVKRLTTDAELVKEAIRNSDLVQLDETGSKVRANSKRLMLLVRGIPEGTSHEEVLGLFESGNCPPSSRCELARSDAWYIYFDSEEDAQKAYQFLREVVQEYKGSPLHVRLKEKVFQRAPPPHLPPFSNLSPRGPMPFQHPHAFPYMPRPPMYVPNMMPWPHTGVFEAAAIQPFANGGFPNPGPPTAGGFPTSPNNLHPRFTPIPGAMGGRRPFDSGPGHHHVPHQPGGQRGRHRPPYRDDSYGHHHTGRGRRRDEDHRSQQYYRARPSQNFELASNQFPPLPTGPSRAEQINMAAPVEEPGTNGKASDITKATYSQSVTKNNSAPSKPDAAVAVGEPRQQQAGGGGGAPVEPPKAVSDGVEQKNGRATQKHSPGQAPPQQQQSSREGGGARQTQGNPPSSRGNPSSTQPKSNTKGNWKSSGSDHRTSGSDQRSSGNDHKSSEYRNFNRGRTKERKSSKVSPRHSPKPNRHSASAPPTPSATATSPEKQKQDAPLPGPDAVSYAAVTQRPKPSPKQANATTETAGKDPSPAQSPSKPEMACSQTQHTDKPASSAANTEQPANRQREESSDTSCTTIPLKEQGDASAEQNH